MKIMRFIFALATAMLRVSGCASRELTPAGHFDSLVIQGTPPFVDQVEQSLALLKARAPAGYAIVTNYVGIIQQYQHSGMEVHNHPPIFQLNTNSAFASVTWCAGVIAHDSFHSKLYFDFKRQHPEVKWIPDKTYGGEQAERVCLAHQLLVLIDIGAPDREIAWCRQCQTQTNAYWQVKYKNRSW